MFDLWKIIGFLILIALSMLSTEFLKNTGKSKQELIRKIPHILIGIILSFSPYFMTQKEIIISAILIVLGIWAGKYSPFFKNIFSIKRITYGMWLVPLTYGLMAWFWLPQEIDTFIFGLLVLTFSDSIASLVGTKWGKPSGIFKIFGKSFLGSLSFFITTFFLFYFFLGKEKIYPSIISSIFLTFMELVLIFGLDNFFIPILSSTIFHFLR